MKFRVEVEIGTGLEKDYFLETLVVIKQQEHKQH